MEKEMEPPELSTWSLSVDGSSKNVGSGEGMVLVSPKEHKLNCAITFNFKATHNALEYEALLAGLRLAREMQLKRLVICSDSQLVVGQVNDNFLAKDNSIATYLKLVMPLINLVGANPTFKKCSY